ncbi:MAG: TRAP transporter small permease, partial [Pseudomonadota bacterium]
LLALIALTLISVTGRGLASIGFGPVPGDFELVEHITAIIICTFLPWCQLHYGHLAIGFVTRWLSFAIRRPLFISSQLCLAIMGAVMTNRMSVGMVDRWVDGQTTFILQIPVWIFYAACLPGLGLFVIACLVTAYECCLSDETAFMALESESSELIE